MEFAQWGIESRVLVALLALGVLAAGCGAGTSAGDAAAADIRASVDGTSSACDGCPTGQVCDEQAGRCVDCLTDASCAVGERCDASLCREVVCDPAETTCESGVEHRCNALGTGWSDTLCAENQVCVSGACHDRLCTPGEIRCHGGLILTCLEPGLSESTDSCPEGELCAGEEGCLPVRHNIVLAVDTSGSMNREPESPNWYDWPEPWPVCESFDAPETRIGIARKLFRRLLAEQDQTFRSSDFVLMRFPQRTTGEFVEDLSAVPDDPMTCRAGLWVNLHDGAIEGDDGAHGTSEGLDDWFATSAWQAVIVPDPREPGFASMSPDARREAMDVWFDGEAEAVPGADAVACTQADALETCGLDRPCLGPDGAKTCHDIVNPELRAQGDTPLGRTIYYASEYLRRFVYVDGMSCESDSDCASANYVCQDGVCSDILRNCREAVIVLLTDGTENPVPEDLWFRALVQAKRVHYGLGCDGDADCLNGATCGARGTCVTTALEDAASVDLAAGDELFDEVLGYVDPDGVQRVEDRRGLPIPMTVHVVDVAGGSSENARLAMLGGGLLIDRSLHELDQLIAGLLAVFDIKAGAECLAEPRSTGE